MSRDWFRTVTWLVMPSVLLVFWVLVTAWVVGRFA